MADSISERERALLQSTGSLLEHFRICDVCGHDGIDYCDDARGFLAIVRVDRDSPAEPITATPPPADVRPCTECGHTDHPGEGRLLEELTDNPNPYHQET